MRSLSTKNKIILGMALLVAVFFSAPSMLRAANETIADQKIDELNKIIQQRKTDIEALQQQINLQQKKIDEQRKQGTTLKNQINLIDNQTVKKELDIQAVKKQVETIGLQIESLELQVRTQEDHIEKQKELMGDFLRLLQRTDEKSYIEILVSTTSFSDFFDTVKNIKTITRELDRALTTLQEKKSSLELKQKELETNQKDLQTLQERLVAEQEELEGQIQLKTTLLTQTKSSELRFQQLQKDLKQQYQQIENEIRAVEKEVEEKLKKQNAFKDSGELKFIWPVPSKIITTLFHDPEYPFRHVFEHNAIDIRAPQGTPIKAAAEGYVARAKRCSAASCYSFVMLIHQDGFSTVYGHMSRITVSEDQFVEQGEVIGYSGGMPGTVGAGPFVTGPHLHFETRVDGIPVNPVDYLGNE